MPGSRARGLRIDLGRAAERPITPRAGERPMATAPATHERALAAAPALRPAVAWTLMLLLIAAVYALLVRPGHAWGDDFSMYILHARAIAEGRSYADTPYIYNPDYAFLGPPAYPPIVPLLLAPVYYVAGLDLVAMKGLVIGSFVAALGFGTLCFHKRLRAEHMALWLVLVGFNIFYLRGVTSIGSDAPFLMFLYLALWLIDRMNDGEPSQPPRLSRGLAAGVAIYLAFGARTVGGVLLPALWVTDLVRSRRVSRATVAATVVFGLLAAAQQWMVGPGAGGYSDQWTFEPLVLLRHAGLYASRLVAFWSNGYWMPLAVVSCLAFTALAVLGYARSLGKRPGVLEVFPLLYLGVILLFPSYQGERFLLPVLPLYVFYALQGLESPWFVSGVGVRRWVAPALVALALLTTVARISAFDFGPIAEGPHRAESVELFDFLREHTGPDDVIVFAKPRALALMTSRRAASFHRAADDERLWAFFDRIGARYVVSFDNDRPLVDGEERAMAQYLREFIARNGERLEPAYANPDFRVYEIRPAAGATQGAARAARLLVPFLPPSTESQS
jgi:hypothetical protein